MANPVGGASSNNSANLADMSTIGHDAVGMQNESAKMSSELSQAQFQKSLVDMLNGATKSAGDSLTKIF